MEWIDEIFVGESVKDLGTIAYSLKRNIPVVNLYCIYCNSSNRKGMEIVSSRQLFTAKNLSRNYIIIGIARGIREAYDLLRYIYQYGIDRGWPPDQICNILLKEESKEGAGEN